MPSQEQVLESISHAPEFLRKAKALSALNPLTASFAIARQWAVIFITAALVIRFNTIPVYILGWIVISTRQHALGVLLHEASHWRLFRRRAINDFVGNLFCALPGGILLTRYRADHLKHHLKPNMDGDPHWRTYVANPRSWQWPKPKWAAVRLLVLDMIGANSPTLFREFSAWLPWRNHLSQRRDVYPLPIPLQERLTLYPFLLLLVTATIIRIAFLKYFLLLWVVPLLTFTQFSLRLRTLGEHFALPEGSGTDATRNIDAPLIERLCISPLNVNLHLTHHLFPQIPYYNLPRMTKYLMSNAEFRSAAHVTSSYLGRSGVLRLELISDKPE